MYPKHYNFVMLKPHIVCITQHNMILTMMMVKIFMSLLKQYKIIELSIFSSYNDLCRSNGVFDKFHLN